MFLRYSFCLLFGLMLSFASCSSDQPEAVKVLQENKESLPEKEQVKLKIERMEKELFSVKGEPAVSAKLPAWQKQYGNFFLLYVERMINVGKRTDPKLAFYLNHFLSDGFINELYREVGKNYNDMSAEEKSLSQAFTEYHYYFPKKRIPRVISFISGFNYGITASDSVLGIGLDMFLGAGHEYYSRLQVPQFISHFMNRENLVPEAMKGWLSTEFPVTDLNPDLLNDMIQEGKVLLTMDAIFPDLQDSVKIRYTAPQMEWIKANEEKCWKYFVEHQLLFKKDYMEKRKYLGEAPFTTGLPRESPPRLAQYFGWQIVRAYVARQKETNLERLFATEAQKIMNLSKYKPQQNKNS